MAQQLEALRDHAAREGYMVLEEVADAGQSGASLERPGMDCVRDLVASGGVSVVLAQDRDRFTREPAYHYLLKREFGEHRTKIRSLNDRGDESPEGELTDGILDQLAKFERAKTTERTRRGKLRRAREGKIVAGNRPTFGFEYNAGRDNYVVHPEEIRLVARIFRMVGVEGATLYSVKRAFEREGISAPGGQRDWAKSFIRDRILNDVYKPHGFEEILALVTPEVAGRLDPERRYGIWWFNRNRHTLKQVAEDGPGGRVYRRRTKIVPKPREEWIAVPVPDAGIPDEWVEAARQVLTGNDRISKNGSRFWELSGGVLRCAACGWKMKTTTVKSKRSENPNFYYRCSKQDHYYVEQCPNRKVHRADRVEPRVWGLYRSCSATRTGCTRDWKR
jgi:site-specific DNA recombinase